MSTVKGPVSARVTSVMMTSHRRSRITCTSACLNENAAGHVCMTATYDRQSGQCELSTDPQREMTFTGDSCYMGIVVTRPLPTPPPPTTTTVAPPPTTTTTAPQTTDSGSGGGNGGAGANGGVHTQYGRSFVFAFAQNYKSSNVLLLRFPYVQILSQETTWVNICYPNFTETVQLQGATVLQKELDMAAAQVTDKGKPVHMQQAGVEITSDKDIAVFAISRKNLTGDGSVIAPDVALGTSYILHTTCKTASEVMITAARDDTDVTVERPDGSKDPAISLNRLDVLKVSSCNLIPAGTLIKATKSVAVQVGCNCPHVPDWMTESCDNIMTSLPPVDKLQKTFIVPEMYPRTNFSIGLVSPDHATTVDIYDAYSTLLQTLTMNRQDSQFLQFSEALVIESSQPLLVVQYGHGADLTLGDPSITVIPPPEHFTNVYRFTVPTWYSAPSYACAIVLSGHASDVRVNQVSVVPSASRDVTIPDTGETYKVLYFPVTVHGVAVLLDHADPNVNFAAFVYARSQFEEYATLLGFKF